MMNKTTFTFGILPTERERKKNFQHSLRGIFKASSCEKWYICNMSQVKKKRLLSLFKTRKKIICFKM